MATDVEVSDFLEHFGIKGQKWGVRKEGRAQNRALNKASRQEDKRERTANIDRARASFNSVSARKQMKNAKSQYHKDKIDKGSREARKILNKTRTSVSKDYATSQAAKNGKEIVGALAVGAILYKALTSSTVQTMAREQFAR